MIGLMQDTPLSLDRFLWRASRLFADSRIVTGDPSGNRILTVGQWHERTCRLNQVLEGLGITAGGRVGSLCWSTSEHLELSFGVPCAGRVLHTLNPRLPREALADTIDQAADEVIFVHHSLLDLAGSLLQSTASVRHLVIIGAEPTEESLHGVRVLGYENLLDAAESIEPVVPNERSAASLCFTGGTTGPPKGVLYSHRSLVLHALATTSAGGIGINEHDVVMPLVPLFHANAVGFAHAAIATGADLVLPGQDLSGGAVADLLESERVSVTCGVPTIWSAVLPALAGRDLPALRMIISGASAVPPSLSEAFREVTGVPLTQIWGMTETSPLGTMTTVRSTLSDLDEESLVNLRATVGMPVPGVEIRIVSVDGDELPWDGDAAGELQARGWWVASGYLDAEGDHGFTEDGWLRTGDVATVDPHGYVRIVDRLKDVIKSGGEWISSITLENLLAAHPDIVEVAVVAVKDDHWGERPLACVVVRPGAAVDADAVRHYLQGAVPSWWIPDRVEFVDEIPRTSVGKFAKSILRDWFADSGHAT